MVAQLSSQQHKVRMPCLLRWRLATVLATCASTLLDVVGSFSCQLSVGESFGAA
jgi:hypothetical protein